MDLVAVTAALFQLVKSLATGQITVVRFSVDRPFSTAGDRWLIGGYSRGVREAGA
jgi:hypothetical protein